MAATAGSAGRAIILKGPTASSKSFFTVLPGTLEELNAKASALFPVPSGHNGQLVLDNGAILMPDVLPFLHEREILTFRHAPDTPRSSLKRPAHFEVAKEATRSHTSSTSTASQAVYDDSIGSSGGSSSGSRASRNVRWSDSVKPKDDTARKEAAAASLPPAKLIRYSAAGRAEHARRVLGEQEQRRREEELLAAAQKSASATIKPTREHESASARNDGASGSNSKRSLSNADATDPFLSTAMPDAQSSARKPSQPFKAMTMDDLLVSGSSPPSYTSATTAHARVNSEEEQQGSSPVASPTRNIRGAQRQGAEWMTPLGTEKPAQGDNHDAVLAGASDVTTGSTDEAPTAGPTHVDAKSSTASTSAPTMTKIQASESTQAEGSSHSTAPPASTQIAPHEEVVAVPANKVDEEEERAVEQAIAPEMSPRRAARVAAAYQRMTSVIDTLQSHPANVYFRQPICFDDTSNGFADFLQRTGRPVIDFAIIRQGLDEHRYGKTDPFAAVVADLDRMWANAKAYFGPTSNQGRCADFMDRFGKVILAEWRRETDKKATSNEHHTPAAPIAAPRRANKDSAAKFLRGVGNTTKRSAMPTMVSDAMAKGSPRSVPAASKHSSASRTDGQDENAALQNGASAQSDGIKSHSETPLAPCSPVQEARTTSPSKSDANSDALLKLQQQFGPLPRSGRQPAKQAGRAFKRPNQSALTGDRKRVRESAPLSIEKNEVSAPLPTVTVTDETSETPAVQSAEMSTTEPISVEPAEEAVAPSVETTKEAPIVAKETSESTPRSSPRTKQRQQADTKKRTSPRFRTSRKGSAAAESESLPSSQTQSTDSPSRTSTRLAARTQKVAA